MAKKMLTVKEACERTRTTPKSMREWLITGRIPGYKIGDEWRIDEAELEEWIAARKNKVLTPEQLAVTLAAPNGRVKEENDQSLTVNVGWPEEQ
jgi:excisionase family DNA binding protein